MGISIYNIKRWTKMILGKSIYHVDQGLGQVIDKGGYYNDLTNKVLLGNKNVDNYGIPFLVHSDGSHVHMPTMVFQYGLGAYDLWLLTQDRIYLEKVQKCANWAVEKQEKSGAWNNFSHVYPDHPYGAMCQGEGISLLVRAYISTGEEKYLDSAQTALEFMLKPVQEGGTTSYEPNGTIFLEYTHKPVVLNGWIFSIIGLYDYSKTIGNEYVKKVMNDSLLTLSNYLPRFDNGYWSKYNITTTIASPFYHNLHIAQLTALEMIFEKSEFKEYADRWHDYNRRPVNRIRAFIVKSAQKILER